MFQIATVFLTIILGLNLIQSSIPKLRSLEVLTSFLPNGAVFGVTPVALTTKSQPYTLSLVSST